ncbi:transposon TX1, partial [Tanacetum coccineum]
HHVSRQKTSLWDRLTGLMNRWNGAWCIFGDLNVVRCNEDRLNCQVNIKESIEFNDFINDMRLLEIPMGGRKFTRVSDDGINFSKLDRFLLNDEFNNLLGNLSVIALDRKLSDHCPIVLKDVDLDFGPKPFRVFNVWMEEPDFYRVVEEAWKKEVKSFRPDCIFRDKLKNVKVSLRTWSKERFGGFKEKIKALKNEAMKWELVAENKTLSESERGTWLQARKDWEEKEREYCSMLRQKTRIKWDTEGDENSKFYHSFVKRRNNRCSLRGLMVDGVWDPKSIKVEAARHYKKLFSEGAVIRPIFFSNKIVKISMEEAIILEKAFDEKEVWDAVRGCGGDKAPGPDGFNFKFIRKVWEVIKPDVLGAIGWFWDNMVITKGCNASFVTIIPKVIVKMSMEEAIILEKDFDEQEVWDAVRSEGLNAIVNKAVEKGIFRGVTVGANNVTVSHLQYADDTIFSEIGVKRTPNLLFNEDDMTNMARWMGCDIGEFPFTYLGLPIAENMRRVNAWTPVVEKFKKRLADWKAKTMSFNTG